MDTHKSVTPPTAPDWTPATLLMGVLDLVHRAEANRLRSPFVLHLAKAWEPYLSKPYVLSSISEMVGKLSIREKLLKVGGITNVVTDDTLQGWDAALIAQVKTGA